MYKEIIFSCCLLLLVQRGSGDYHNNEIDDTPKRRVEPSDEFSGLGYLNIIQKGNTLKKCDLHINGLNYVQYYNYTKPGKGLIPGITHIQEYGEWKAKSCSIRIDLAKLARFAKSKNKNLFGTYWHIVGHWTEYYKLPADSRPREDHFKFFMNTPDWIKKRSYSVLTLKERITSKYADTEWI